MEAAERNPDKNKYKALAAIAVAVAVFSLLVFCVASRFVSYWTAAKGEKGKKREAGKPFPFLVFLQISSSSAVQKKSCQKQLVPQLTLRFFPQIFPGLTRTRIPRRPATVRYLHREPETKEFLKSELGKKKILNFPLHILLMYARIMVS